MILLLIGFITGFFSAMFLIALLSANGKGDMK